MEQIADNRCFGGRQLRFSHASTTLDCSMNFSVYLPPAAEAGRGAGAVLAVRTDLHR